MNFVTCSVSVFRRNVWFNTLKVQAIVHSTPGFLFVLVWLGLRGSLIISLSIILEPTSQWYFFGTFHEDIIVSDPVLLLTG